MVFDLDYTLWPFWIDTHVTPPLKATADHTGGTDKFGEEYTFYDDVPSILQTLPLGGIRTAVASRTCAPALAKQLLKMIQLPAVDRPHDADGPSPSPTAANKKQGGNGEGGTPSRRALDAFDCGLEIYPSSKIRHFEAIHKRTGIRYDEMLFFDDESRNRDTESLGVTMYLVRDGVTWGEIEKGVNEWRRRAGYRQSK